VYSLPSPVIHFVSAKCGLGKTYSTCRYIADHIEGQNFLYVAPTKRLLNQTRDELRRLGVFSVEVICDETNSNHVKTAIMDRLRHAKATHHVLCITHKSYFDLPFIWHEERWRIFIDEIPALDTPYDWPLPMNWPLLAAHIELGQRYMPGLYVARAKSKAALHKILNETAHDAVFDQFRPLLQDLLNDNKLVLANLQTVERLRGEGFVDRAQEPRQPDANRVYFMSLLNPKRFKNATLLGADAEWSLLFKWLQSFHGHTMVPQNEILNGLRDEWDMGALLTIKYFSEKGVSRFRAEQKSTDGQTLNIDAMDRWVAANEMPAHKSAIVFQNNYRPKYGSMFAGRAEFVSPYCHGENQYDGATLAYFSAALNRKTWHIKMLVDLGFTAEEIEKATLHHTANQALMRTALRRPENRKRVVFICPDKATAHTVAHVSGCNDVRQIPGLVKEKKEAMTGAERVRKCRLRQQKIGQKM
jgi:hypothetical protein